MKEKDEEILIKQIYDQVNDWLARPKFLLPKANKGNAMVELPNKFIEKYRKELK